MVIAAVTSISLISDILVLQSTIHHGPLSEKYFDREQTGTDLLQSDSKMAVGVFKLPFWIVLWLFTSSIFVLLDAFFVLLRPRTMPGGDLSFLVSYCKY